MKARRDGNGLKGLQTWPARLLIEIMRPLSDMRKWTVDDVIAELFGQPVASLLAAADTASLYLSQAWSLNVYPSQDIRPIFIKLV